jgi:single-strand DNA-binding protein
MYGINKVTLLGNVGQEPEIRTTRGGTKVANLSLATTQYAGKDEATGERRERTEWHRVTVYGAVAELVEKFVSKGSRLYIEGELQTQKWQDRESGQDRYATNIVVGRNGTLLLQDAKKDGRPAGAGHPPRDTDLDEEIPF